MSHNEYFMGIFYWANWSFSLVLVQSQNFLTVCSEVINSESHKIKIYTQKIQDSQFNNQTLVRIHGKCYEFQEKLICRELFSCQVLRNQVQDPYKWRSIIN